MRLCKYMCIYTFCLLALVSMGKILLHLRIQDRVDKTNNGNDNLFKANTTCELLRAPFIQHLGGKAGHMCGHRRFEPWPDKGDCPSLGNAHDRMCNIYQYRWAKFIFPKLLQINLLPIRDMQWPE